MLNMRSKIEKREAPGARSFHVKLNRRRVAFIGRILREDYSEGMKRPDSDMRAQSVRDVLADLRHYCRAHGIDFAREDKAAQGNFSSEVASEKTGFIL